MFYSKSDKLLGLIPPAPAVSAESHRACYFIKYLQSTELLPVCRFRRRLTIMQHWYKVFLQVSGVCTAASLLLFLVHAARHLQHWTAPQQQQLILVIMGMVPVFAVASFVGLLELEQGEVVAHVLDSIKECYEAWVIHAFLSLLFLLVLVSPGQPLPEHMKGRHVHVPWPMSLLAGKSDLLLDEKSVSMLRRWTLQFVLFRPVLSLLDLTLVDLLEYHTQRTSWNN
eukprot:g59159.t1